MSLRNGVPEMASQPGAARRRAAPSPPDALVAGVVQLVEDHEDALGVAAASACGRVATCW